MKGRSSILASVRLAELAPGASFLIRRSSFHAGGYTLVELMIVLALLAALTAVAWPSVLKLRADHDLSAAAEEVRQLLGQARTRAVHAGLAFQFRFEPKGRRYCVIPFEGEPEPVAAPGTGSTSSGKPQVAQRFAGEVSSRITFQVPAANDASVPPALQIPEAAFEGLPDAGTLAAVSWSGPVIFQADGTAMDTVITLGDPRGHRIDISIRGLTGAASVGPMRREELR